MLSRVLWKFPKQVFCAVKLVGGGGAAHTAVLVRGASARVREEMSNEWEEALQIEHEWGTGISSLLHSNEEIEILHQTWHIGRAQAGLVLCLPTLLALSGCRCSFEQVNLVKRNPVCLPAFLEAAWHLPNFLQIIFRFRPTANEQNPSLNT